MISRALKCGTHNLYEVLKSIKGVQPTYQEMINAELTPARNAKNPTEFWKTLVIFAGFFLVSFGNGLATDGKKPESSSSNVKLSSRCATYSQIPTSVNSAAVDLPSLKWEFDKVPYGVRNWEGNVWSHISFR